jgi:phosphoribosylformylglycinamidine synthase
LDCGGKRSATPLWIGRAFSLSETSKAPSPLRFAGALQNFFLRGDRALKFGVIVFPGSNCDHDAYHVISKHVGQPVDFIWHRDTDLSSYDAVIIPGGFSYGDYLRAGALARFSPVMNSVKEFAAQDKLVLGICNGFQILCEAGLLPGALIRNQDLHFVCDHVNVRVESLNTPFTHDLKPGSVLRMPIAHAEGNFVCDEATLAELQRDERIVFRYCDREGRITEEANPNGSRDNIAGICSRGRNVMGLMPHPERACEDLLGSSDGREIFRSLAGMLAAAA